MKVGILGSGNIGGTLAKVLSASGHIVKVANSRGPDTIDADVLSTGAIAATQEETLVGVDAVILSIPFNLVPALAPLFAKLPAETVVIDTSNQIYARDEKVDAIENGQAESAWVAEQLARPIAKAWNTIYSGTMKDGRRPAGDPERIAVPVAADHDRDREVAMALVEESGFDAYDSGSLAASWRQQCGTPSYCTEVTLEELPGALAAADTARARLRQGIFFAAYGERYGNTRINPSRHYIVQLSRLIYG